MIKNYESADIARTRIETYATEMKRYWKLRDDRITSDRYIIGMEHEPKKQGFEQVVLNEPTVLYYTSVAILSAAKPRFRAPVSMTLNDGEKEKMNLIERFSEGVLRELDDRNMQRGDDYWLRELAFWVCSGHVYCFPHVTTYNGKVEFWADLYDPLTCYPTFGRRGLIRFLREYETSINAANDILAENSWELEKELKEGDESKTATIQNFWEIVEDKVINTVLVNGMIAKPPTIHPEFGSELPIIGAVIGGSPERVYPTNWLQNRGQNVISLNREMYPLMNRLATMVMQIIADTAYPPIVDENPTGKATLKAEDMGAGKIIGRRPDSKLELFYNARTPPEVTQLMGIVSGALQRGGISNVVYGNIGFEISGYALSQLLASVKYKLAPYATFMNNIISKIMLRLTNEFRAGNYKVQLMTRDLNKPQKGQFFVEAYKSTDIPECNFLDVSVPLETPQDKNQAIIAARTALTEPRLLSRETIWEDLLNVADTNMEKLRIVNDRVDDLEIVVAIDTLERLKVKEQLYRDKGETIIADALKRYAFMIEQQYGLRQAIPITAEQARSGQSGIPTSFMPPEMAQMNPDMLQSAAGRVPTGDMGGANRKTLLNQANMMAR